MLAGDNGKALVRAAGRKVGVSPTALCPARPDAAPDQSMAATAARPLLHQEASFKEFLSRPENREAVEKHQRKEVKQAIKVQEKMRLMEFREKVLESEFDAQKNVAPFLKNRVLRRIIQTFANDQQGDFAKWACNPRVIEMLREAKRLMDEGYVAEEEMEAYLIRQLADPHHEAHADFARKTRQVARLPTDQLVGALNEHLTERRQGNQAYRARDFAKALHHYERARAVVEFVQAREGVGLSRADQAEVDVNKEYGAAVEFCNKALGVDPRCAKALARRCKAHARRHKAGAAAGDLAALRALDPGHAELAELEAELARVQREATESERETFAHMFDRQRTQQQQRAQRVTPAQTAG
eukprot:scaffold6.g2559.t1